MGKSTTWVMKLSSAAVMIGMSLGGACFTPQSISGRLKSTIMIEFFPADLISSAKCSLHLGAAIGDLHID